MLLVPRLTLIVSAQHHDPSKEDCSLTLRCLHYPPVDNSKIPANYWRAGSHTDFDTLTLLFQVRNALTWVSDTVSPCKALCQVRQCKYSSREFFLPEHIRRCLSILSCVNMTVYACLFDTAEGGAGRPGGVPGARGQHRLWRRQ